MYDYEVFEDVFGDSDRVEYDHKTVKKVRENRTTLEGEIFIDKLLKALGLPKANKQYPPTSHADLRTLHHDITNTSSPDNHKCSVLYYLVKDLHPNPNAPSSIPPRSLNGIDLPPRYKTLIDGLWLLDRLSLEPALDYLIEPSLTPTFPDEILYTLCKHSAASSSLPIAYYQAISPPLDSPPVLETYFALLSRTSITEAYFFARAQGGSNNRHRTLFTKLVENVAGLPSGEEKARQGTELVNLPLDRAEEGWFREVLQSANQGKMRAGADILVMRDIVMGRVEGLEEVVGMTGNRKIGGVNWEGLVRGLHSASG